MSFRRTSLSKDGTTLKITVNWFGVNSVGLGLITAIFVLFVFSLVSHAFRVPSEFLPSLFVTFGMAVAIETSVFLCYMTVAFFINRTEVGVEEQWIVVRHLPLPCPGKPRKKVAVARLKQILVEVKQILVDDEGGVSPFIVYAMTREGENLHLANFNSHEDATFVVEKIYEFLSARDNRDDYVKKDINKLR